MSLIKYPYTNLHELNLDWIIEQLNNKDGPVRSVNGKTGMVTLTGEDIARSSSNPETVSAALNTQGTSIQTVRNQIGVTPLPTVAQTLTGAIAENAQEIADVEDNVIGNTELPTEAQTLTGAIAENADNIGGNAQSITNINNKIGSTTLPTTAQTLSGAIAEQNNSISAINTQLGNIAKRTQISATSTNYTEVYEFANGLAILCARLTVPVEITTVTGSLYYGTIAPMDWGYTFYDRPTVTVTARGGSTNGWVWQQSGATTTQTPGLFIGRGTSATGNVVLEFHAIGYHG